MKERVKASKIDQNQAGKKETERHYITSLESWRAGMKSLSIAIIIVITMIL